MEAAAAAAASGAPAADAAPAVVAVLRASGNQPQDVVITQYEDETQMDDIMALISKDLSEPYSVFTYRYFLAGWPRYCLLVRPYTPRSVRVPAPRAQRHTSVRSTRRPAAGYSTVLSACLRRGMAPQTACAPRATLRRP